MPTNINTSNNTVVIQPTNYTVSVTNNNVGSTTNVTNPYTTVINVTSLGPQGIPGVQGVAGAQGDSIFSNLGGGVFATTSSIQVTGSFTVSGSSTFTNIGPAVFSGSTAISGALTVNGYDIVTVNQTSSLTALSASHAATASYLNTLNQNLTFNGNLTLNGTASIAYLNVQYESASIIYSSGSNQLGDAANDTQTLYGSVIIPTGSLTVSGSVITSGSDATINGVRVGRGGGNVADNTALGESALNLNTNGSGNLAISYFALSANVIGSNNTAVGSYALRNSTQSNNTAMGYASFLNLSSGTLNTALGRQAARYIADGSTSLTIANQSIFIGADTKALADSQTNQIVIGYNAIGLGSNSVVLGNSSITLTALRGNVLINTTTNAGFGLDVSGSGRFTNNLTVTGSTTITGEANVSFLSLSGNTAVNNSGTTMILGTSGAWTGVRIPKNLEVTGSAIISSSANTQLQVGSNFLFVSGSGNVGIGTTTPSQRLTVGTSDSDAILIGVGGRLYLRDTTTYITEGSGLNLVSGATRNIRLNAGGTDRLFVSASGNVGIGTNTPGYALEIANTGLYYAGASSAAQLLITTSGSVNREGSFIAAGAGGNRTLQLGILDNSTVPVGIDMIETNDTFGSTYLNFRVNNANLVRMTGSFVGIGTTTPAYNLDVSGSAKINDGIFGLGTTGNILPLISPTGTGTVAIGGTSPNTPALRFQGSPLNFFIGSTQVAQFFATTGNLLLQNGGTFTDNGYRLQIDASGSSNSSLPLALTSVDTNNRVGILFASSSISSGRQHRLLHRVNTPTVEWLLGTSAGETATWRFLPQDNTNYAINILTPYNGGTAYITTGLSQSLFSLGAGSQTAQHINISSSGNVGIGTATPASTLDVSGSARITNGLTVTGSVAFASSLTVTSAMAAGSSLAVGTFSPAVASAQLEIVSTTRGFLPPRTATTASITSPAQGLITYLTGSTNEGLYYYNSGSQPGWHKMLTNTGSQSITGSLNIQGGATLESSTTVASITSLKDFGFNVISQIPQRAFLYGRYSSNPNAAIGIGGNTRGNTAIQGFNYTDNSSTALSLQYYGGNVLIGEYTSALLAKLYISGSNTEGLLRIDSPTVSGSLFVSGSGNVGIGTITPDSYYAKKLVISSPDENGITIAGISTSATNYLAFADGTSGNQAYRGYISYKHLSDQLAFGSSGTLRATIDSAGNFGIGTSTNTILARTHIQGSGATSATTTFLLQNSTPTNLLSVLDNGQVAFASPTITLAASQSAFSISPIISASNTIGGQYYGVSITPTFYQTTGSQTETAFRVAATFSQSSAAATGGTNIIADFGSTSAGSQLTVTDVTSGSIYMVNDVSGIPIIEATSNWDVNIYDFPNKVFEKTGTQVNIYGTMRVSGSFILPLSQSAAPQTGSAYWSGSLLFIYNGTRYMSASFA